MKEKVNKNTEAAILEAAESLFKTNGFKGTTTTMIAGQAGVTHAMLHYYFRTKEQIFVKVLDGYFLKMHNELRMLMSPGKGMVETVLDVTASLFDFMQMHQGEIRLLLEIAANRADLLEKYNLPFDVMLPLIDETARKVHELAPRDAQTGPAVRYDENVMNNHLAMLVDSPALQEIYKLMSKSIHEHHQL